MVMKRRVLLILVASIVCLSSLLSACGNASEKEEKSDAGENKQVTLQYWMATEGKVVDDYFLSAAQEFENQNPDIKVEVTFLPAGSQNVEPKLNAAKLSGTLPDVFNAYYVFMSTLANQGDFEPLDAYTASWGGKDRFYDSVFNMGNVNGTQYALAFSPVPEVFAYRKDFFEEAGLDPEKPPTSWEELAEFAQKLVVRDGNGNVTRAGLDIPYIDSSNFIEPFMWQNGAQTIDVENDVPLLDEDKAIEALTYMVNLASHNVSIPFNNEKKDEIPFVNEKSAMVIANITVIRNMLEAKPELKGKIGIAPVMQRKVKQNFAGNRMLTIFKTSKHKDESWKFIEFLMSDEQVWKRNEIGIPNISKSLEQQYTNLDPEYNEIIAEYVQYGRAKANVPWVSLFQKYLNMAYEEAMSNKKTPDQALQDAQQNLLKEMQNLKS